MALKNFLRFRAVRRLVDQTTVFVTEALLYTLIAWETNCTGTVLRILAQRHPTLIPT